MSDGPFNAAEIGISLGLALEAARLPYALGGALALGVWSLPRATKDVDLNLFVTPGRLDEAFDVLQAQGVALDRAEARRAATDEGLFIGWAGACRIAFFKMMFFRGKDLVDLERLLSAGAASFDAAWVRRWLVDTVGDDDPRIQRWDDLCARFVPRG